MLGVLVVATALVALRLTAVGKKARQAPRLLGTSVARVPGQAGLASVVCRQEETRVASAAMIVFCARDLLNENTVHTLTFIRQAHCPRVGRSARGVVTSPTHRASCCTRDAVQIVRAAWVARIIATA